MTIHFNSNWKEGEIKEYQLIKKKIKTEKGIEISRKETSKIIEIQVLESNDTSDLLKWTEFEDSKSLISRLFFKIFKERLDEIFSISYRTNKSGIINELVDKKDLYKQIQLLKKQLKKIGNTHQEKELLESALDDEVISTHLLKSMFVFHFPYGEAFSETPIMKDIQMANPFSEGNKFPGKIINSYLYIDKASQIGEIQIEKKYDQPALNKAMKATLSEIDIKLEKSRKEELPLFVATEIFTYKVNLASSSIINGKYEKVLLSKNFENTETVEFQLIS
jgi:hypothetical protein